MILDYSNTFDTSPDAGFATSSTYGGGTLTASYNAEAQAVDLSLGMYNGYWIHHGYWILTSQPTSGPVAGINPVRKLSFEVDIELVSDPSGRRHFGIWLVQEGATFPGYLVYHLDRNWSISRGGYLGGSLQNMSPSSISNPSFTLGERHVLRVDYAAGAFTAYLDGYVIFTASDSMYTDLRPGIFLFGCTVRVHSVHYQLDDIVLSVGDIGLGLAWANPETREQAWPGEYSVKETLAQLPEKAFPVLAVSALSAPPSRSDLGYIAGVITRKGVVAPNKHVICLDARFNLVAETTSAENGYYRFDNLPINGLCAIHAYDNETYQYAPVGADRRTPEAYP